MQYVRDPLKLYGLWERVNDKISVKFLKMYKPIFFPDKILVDSDISASTVASLADRRFILYTVIAYVLKRYKFYNVKMQSRIIMFSNDTLLPSSI